MLPHNHELSPRAAVFLRDALHPVHPFYKNAITLLLDAGCRVDVFAPAPPQLEPEWEGRVTGRTLSFTSRWLLRNAWRLRWRRYRLFMGSDRLGLAFAGLLGFLHRRPHVSLCDEIFTGSYYGNDPLHWVRLTNWAHRRAAFTILPDLCREPLLRDMAALAPSHPVYELPCCSRTPPEPGDRAAVRRRWGVPPSAFVLLHSGAVHHHQGCHWMIDALPEFPADTYLVIQSGAAVEDHLLAAYRLLAEHYALRFEVGERLPWADVDHRIAAADVGLVFYFHTGPQFQHEGKSSTKLCSFLRSGIPVIASRQDSFHFLEEHGCGVLVDSPAGFLEAAAHIRQHYTEFSRNALRCFRECIAPSLYTGPVARAFSALLHSEMDDATLVQTQLGDETDHEQAANELTATSSPTV